MPQSNGSINAHSRSSAPQPYPTTRSPGQWDWRRLTALALSEAARYLDNDQAHDAAQEATIRAWRRAHTCSGPPEPWLRTIARNEALRLLNRRREEPLPDEWECCGESDEPPYKTSEILAALADLNPSERLTIFLRYWSDKSDAEIAQLLAIPIGTVKIRLHRAREKLARALSEA